MLTVPKEIQGLHIIASFSGGKDSTALLVALQASGLPFTAVFADTGWEHPLTLEYVDYVAEKLGIVVHKVEKPGGMVARVKHGASFPTRLGRWCTPELKIDPIKKYTHNLRATVGDTAMAVGVRADESAKRATLPELSDDYSIGGLDGYVWRPMLSWTIADVLTTITGAGLKVNPLYQMGMDRVGCFPCIFAGKSEIRAMAKLWPERVDQIEAMEAECVSLKVERNLAERDALLADGWEVASWANVPIGGQMTLLPTQYVKDGKLKRPRYATMVSTMFMPLKPGVPNGIRRIVQWAQDDRGGQIPMWENEARGGCMSWGLCDLPSKKD